MEKEIVELLLVGIGVAFIIYNYRLTQKFKKSFSWHCTKGEIKRSEVVEDCDPVIHTWTAQIEYTYYVNKVLYKSNQVCISDISTSSKKRAEKKTKKYPVGTIINVYYDSNNPKIACLERKVEAGKIFHYLGVYFCLIGFLTFLGVIIWGEDSFSINSVVIHICLTIFLIFFVAMELRKNQ